MSVTPGTPMMIAREKYHAVRSVETAKGYADAALVEKDFGSGSRAAMLVAVAGELTHGKFADDAVRCMLEADEETIRVGKGRGQ